MYKALVSFTTKDFDVRKGQILAEDFTTEDEIEEYLNIGYIEEYDGSIEITENGTYDVADYEQAVVDVSGGGGGSDLDWTAIGYNSRPQAITDGYNHAKEIKDNWTPATSLQSKLEDDRDLIIMPLVDLSITTNIRYMFRSCNALIEIPLLNISNVSNMYNTFANCYALKNVPILNTSSVTNFTNAFTSCYSLTNKSLDNILQMCINATSYTGTKTLQNIGFNSSFYPASRIQALPSYQAFLDAGWTIGY